MGRNDTEDIKTLQKKSNLIEDYIKPTEFEDEYDIKISNDYLFEEVDQLTQNVINDIEDKENQILEKIDEIKKAKIQLMKLKKQGYKKKV